MPKQVDRLGWSEAGDPVMLTDTHRVDAERVYGHPIPDEVWVGIVLKTAVYAMIAVGEQTPTLDDVTRRIERIKIDAEVLLGLFGSGDLPAQRTSLNEIAEAYFHIPKKTVHDNDIFPLLQHALAAVIETGSFTLASLASADNTAAADPKGTAWASWIKNIIRLLEAVELPTAIRKDEGDASAFARLIFQLQRSFPPDLQRHMPKEIHEMTSRIGLGRLSKAISDVRKKTLRPTLIDADLTNLTKLFRAASSLTNTL